MRSDITPIVITFNEAPNIGRVLQKLQWAQQVLVIDSGSTDETLKIVSEFSNTRVIQRDFDTFAGQCNFGLQQVDTPWVLSLDADYVLSDELAAEIDNLPLSDDVAGFEVKFRYLINGKPLRGSLYPPRVMLYRRYLAEYVDLGHGHKVSIRGAVNKLSNYAWHDDRKPYSRWLQSQKKYAVREAQYLNSADGKALKLSDAVRKLIFVAPILAPLYALFARGCFFDGPPGWEYARQRMVAELEISKALLRSSKPRSL